MSRTFRVVPLEDRTVPATFTVTSFDDLDIGGFDPTTGMLPGGEITLRSAILAANATAGADTVVAPTGTYDLTRGGADDDGGGTGDLDITDSLDLQLNGSTIDASGLGDRVLDVPTPEPIVTISNGTIRNGSLEVEPFGTGTPKQGGGIRSLGSLTLDGVTVTGNAVQGIQEEGSGATGQGGGIWATNQLVVKNSVISGNSAFAADVGFGVPAAGGGIYFQNGSVRLTNTRVTGNRVFAGDGNPGGTGSGGGLELQSATATLDGVRVDGNTAFTDGAGGTAIGGGINSFGGSLSVARSTIDGNTADGRGSDPNFPAVRGTALGGGLRFGGDSVALTLENVTVSGNLARGGDGGGGTPNVRGQAFGGGVYFDATSFTSGGSFLGNVTVTNNEAAVGAGGDAILTAGGGFYQSDNANATVQSSILAGNRAPQDPDLVLNGDTSSSGGSNLIGVPSAAFIPRSNDQVGTAAAPLDPQLTALGYFGGPANILVHALNPGGPARDADFNTGPTTDARGTGFDRPVGTRSDIGAFEVQVPAVVTQTAPPLVTGGQPFTVTAAVTDPRFPPTGGVTLLIDGQPSGTGTLDPATGTFTFTPTAPTTGPFTVAITYAGDAAYFGRTSAPSTVTLRQPSTTTVAVSAPAVEGQPITFTATVTTPSNSPVTGTVAFSADGNPVGSATVDTSGQATLTLPAGLLGGPHAVTADYTSTSGLLDSSGSAPFVVQAPTATGVAANPSPAFTNQPLTLTAAVTSANSTPTVGSITFFLDDSPLGTVNVDASGQAAFPLPAGLSAGSYIVSAAYSAGSFYLGSTSAPVPLTVSPAPTTTTVALSPNSPTTGTPLTLTSSVTAAFGSPTGSVAFNVAGRPVGTGTIDSSGTATLSLPSGLPPGTYTLRADYPGVTGVQLASSSPELTVTLTDIATATTVTASPNPVFATDPFTLTAVVTGRANSTPTGSVSFFLDGVLVGTATLDGTGRAVLSLPDGVHVGDGSYAVTATYGGDATFSTSTSPPVALAVNPVPTRTTLTADPDTATQGTAVTLTADVAFNLPAPQRRTAAVNPAILAGTVNFFNGPTLLGSAPVSNGTATLTVTSLPVGVNAITAVFVPATTDLAGSSGTAAATITAPVIDRSNRIFAVGSGYGIITAVSVYDGDGNLVRTLQPFGPNYWCGAVVATGDVTGDGIDDVVVTAPLGAAARVEVYDGVTFNVIANFFAYDPKFPGGASLAVGDLTGDGVDEIVVGAGPGGGPAVNVYSFTNGAIQLVNSFFAYDPSLRTGITVAVSGGLLATGPGYLGGPAVNVYSGPGTKLVNSFFAFDPASRDGVNVALSFDGTRTVLTVGTGAGRLPTVSTFDATTGDPIESSLVYEPGFLGGVTVTNVKSASGELRTVYGTGIGGGPRVRIFGPSDVLVKDFFAFDPEFRGGIFVG